MRREWILIAVFLAACAIVLLYKAASLPESSAQPASHTASTATVAAPTSAQSRYAVNVNEATLTELMGVKGLSEKQAQAIVDDRNENGRYYTLEDLLRVPGVGEATLEQVRPYLRAE